MGTLHDEQRAALSAILDEHGDFADVLAEACALGLDATDVLSAVRFPDEPERAGARFFDPEYDWVDDLFTFLGEDLEATRQALARSGRPASQTDHRLEHRIALRAAHDPHADVDAVLSRSSAPDVVATLCACLPLDRLVAASDRLPPGAASDALLRRFPELARWAAIPELPPDVAWRALPERFAAGMPDAAAWIAARVDAREALGGSWWDVVAFAHTQAPWSTWLPTLVRRGLDDNAAALVALENGASIPEAARLLLAAQRSPARVLDALASCIGGPTPALRSLADAGWSAAALASSLRGQGRLSAEIREHLRELAVPDDEAAALASEPP